VTVRDRRVLAIVAVIIAVVAAWILVIQPKRDQASKLASQVSAAQRQLASARTRIAVADQDRSEYARNYEAVAALGEALPSDDETGSLIYELQSAATGAGVNFQSLVLDPAASAPAATTTSTSKSSASQAVTATLPPGAAVGPAGLPTLPFTFTFQGNFFHLANFMRRLERFVVATDKKVSVSGRLMSLNGIDLGAGPRGFPQITATISATTYLVPSNEGLTDGASPSGPAASSSVHTVSGSTSSTPPTAAITP
jgi:type II secretory pathway pseudopilin PulG